MQTTKTDLPYEAMMLEEFIRQAAPVPDNIFDRNSLPRIWKEYMNEARIAHENAEISFRYHLPTMAYLNALHAIGCYAAAHAAAKGDSRMLATAKATREYLRAIDEARTAQPLLDECYFDSKK